VNDPGAFTGCAQYDVFVVLIAHASGAYAACRRSRFRSCGVSRRFGRDAGRLPTAVLPWLRGGSPCVYTAGSRFLRSCGCSRSVEPTRGHRPQDGACFEAGRPRVYSRPIRSASVSADRQIWARAVGRSGRRLAGAGPLVRSSAVLRAAGYCFCAL
jgi:hypothetical protein